MASSHRSEAVLALERPLRKQLFSSDDETTACYARVVQGRF
jgi:hypothetical protein